eukprot:TRINITY_DN66045_c7_g10_i1.p1 TRINITY_DN66045_c7_g10~~TRINITY_DN66045_c7_g10_i1.p1  ORF type:complete len:512 (-),score=244.62 TRINITY_DN66045_c7_g10_i1:558-1904(-)
MIVRQLQDDGFPHAAAVVEHATKVVADLELPRNQLLEVVSEHLRMDRVVDASTGLTVVVDGSAKIAAEARRARRMDESEDGFGKEAEDEDGDDDDDMLDDNDDLTGDGKARRKRPTFPKYTTRFVAAHKGPCRTAAFHPDGQIIATGSSDTTIKVIDVEKAYMFQQVKDELRRSNGVLAQEMRPVVKTLYDHAGPVTDLVFHPTSPLLISASSDQTIKFFDYSKQHHKRALKHINVSQPVRSIDMHPSGDFLLAGTNDAVVRLYDTNSFRTFTAPNVNDNHIGSINCIRFSSRGSRFASCSKDGSFKIWDAVTFKCLHTVRQAHHGHSVSTVAFTSDQRYVLTSGKDSIVRLWDCNTGKQVQYYSGCKHHIVRPKAIFDLDESFVISGDEQTNSVIAWDIKTGQTVDRLKGHNKAIAGFAQSPRDKTFVSCSEDYRMRLWSCESIGVK